MIYQKKHRLLCAILVSAILFSAVAFVAYHGEWWFPLLERFRVHTELPLEEVNGFDSTTVWTLEQLQNAKGVTVSDTMLLINESHALPEGYQPSLTEYNGAKMHPQMVNAYIAMRNEVEKKTGVRVYVAADYRTAEEQAELLASSEEGTAAAIGCSEHEAGLALDIYAPYFAGKNFLRSRAGRMINRICSDYGFIVRYPVGKSGVTGISYEPWHLRYVGEVHAKLMTESGLTYEEYLTSLQRNTWYRVDNYLIARCDADRLEIPNGWAHCEISSDNMGSYLVTLTVA